MAVDLNSNDAILRHFLNNISQDLGNINLKHMIFLLYDLLPRSKLEKVECGNDLFELLLNEGMMNLKCLGDLLALIRRRDLQNKVIRFSQEFKVRPMSAFNTSCIPTPLRKLMYKMAEGMSSEMVEEMKFLIKVSETSLSHSDKLDALDIFDYFIKSKPIHNIPQIPEKLKDIPDVITLYKKHYLEYEQIDGSEESIQPSAREYKTRFSSFFSGEDVPTFETEYLHTDELDIQEDNKAATELGRGTFGVINTGNSIYSLIATICLLILLLVLISVFY